MGNIGKKAQGVLKRRQTIFDNQRSTKGEKRPGSVNPDKCFPIGKKRR